MFNLFRRGTPRDLQEEFSKFLDRLDELEVKDYIKNERIKWLERKQGIKCHHDNLKYIGNKVICHNCGKQWDRWNVLSD